MPCPKPGGLLLWLAGLWGFLLFAQCGGTRYCAGTFQPLSAPLDSTLAGPPSPPDEYAVLRGRRTIGWEMNNILFSSTDKSLNKFKNLEESTISVTAVFYDDALAAAWLRADTAGGPFTARLAGYRQRHRPDSLFRITLSMESHFARQSLDPAKWTMYLVDENGDMYEPDSIRSGGIQEDRVERWERNQKYFRDRYRVDLDLYFRKITFYGRPVLGPDRRSLRLVMACDRTVIGEAAWCFTPSE